MNDVVDLFGSLLEKQWNPKKNKVELFDPTLSSDKKLWWKCSLGHSWKENIHERIVRNLVCPYCDNVLQEKELAKFIGSLTKKKIVVNDKNLIFPWELDVFVPSKNIAFDYNGLYFHSDEVVRKRWGMSAANYHNAKVEKCRAKRIKLFFVWQNDWLDHREYVESNIRSFFV